MASFECKVYELKIEDHPNADALELAVVGDYRSIVGKGQYQTGDLAVYIPEQAVVPDWAIKRMGLEGKLAGKKSNRVKAIKLRGILSQGLIYPLELRKNVIETGTAKGETPQGTDVWVLSKEEGGPGHAVVEGDDVTEWMGIEKYEPPIPTSMSGEVQNMFGYTLKYDIENIKKYPNVLIENEQIVVTEKIHGTWTCIGYHPDIGDNHPIVTSKGMSEKGLAFKLTEENYKKNLYLRTLQGTTDDNELNVFDRLIELLKIGDFFDCNINTPVYILGETFGQGVQDLTYGAKGPSFRVFDIYVGVPTHGFYLDKNQVNGACVQLNVDCVPFLFKGPYSKQIVEQLTSGIESVSGSGTNIREGVVINTVPERYDLELGRVVLKSVSEDYLTRKGGTEHN